jgi:RNA polymerase sigma factor (sigma-70 family)
MIKQIKRMTPSDFDSTLAGLQHTLAAFTRRFTSDREESEDLVQDTLLKALTYRSKFTNDSNLKGWLFTIMRNTYINSYRKVQRSKLTHDHSREQYMLSREDTHTFHRPQESLEFKEVWRNMNSIREELLLPFKMYITGYKYHEISRHLHLPIGTVKNRIFHARKEIQKKLVG